MKKIYLLISLLFLFPSTSFAGFDWGKSTYENYDDILIINSLGDQVAPATFGKLGVNDFIPENSVKNYLALEGYTEANDYNPTITNPQFVDYYDDKPSEEYTKLTFAGLQGDPRANQDVYVLTKEYKRLNSEQQAVRMDNIDNTISTETNNRVNADNILQSNINTVDTNSKTRDNTLQDNIDSEALTRSKNDNILNSRINDVDNRVEELEKTQNIVTGEVRLFDSKKIQINAFVNYSTTRSAVSEQGIKFTYKMGKSYEEKRLDELEKRLNNWGL